VQASKGPSNLKTGNLDLEYAFMQVSRIPK